MTLNPRCFILLAVTDWFLFSYS